MSANQQRSGWRGLRAIPAVATTADNGGARRAQQPAAREPPTEAEAGNLLKGGSLVRSGDERDPTEGFRFVSDHQADYPIAAMCRLLGVSPSGYYAWAKRQTQKF